MGPATPIAFSVVRSVQDPMRERRAYEKKGGSGCSVVEPASETAFDPCAHTEGQATEESAYAEMQTSTASVPSGESANKAACRKGDLRHK